MRFVPIETLRIRTDPTRFLLYQSIQEEISHVIEAMGESLDEAKENQLLSSLQKMSLQSDQQIVLDFDPPVSEPNDSPREPETLPQVLNQESQVLEKEVTGFCLDSFKDRAVEFQISLFEKKPEGQWLLRNSDSVFFVYQENSGRWLSSYFSGYLTPWQRKKEDSRKFQSTEIFGVDSYELLTHPKSMEALPLSFKLKISPGGILTVQSPECSKLSPTRIIFSHFKFMRKP